MEFESFKRQVEEIFILKDASQILSWDQEVMMPPEGVKPRKKQTKTLSGIAHQKIASKNIEESINKLENEGLNEKQYAILREVRREHKRTKKVPEELNKKISEKGAENVEKWRKAKEENNYDLFKQDLEEMVELKRRYAEEINPDKEPYQVLFEDYEPYLDFDKVEKIMERLEEEIAPVLKKIKEEGKEIESDSLSIELSDDKNMELARKTAETIGFDFERGRLDTSSHPFTVGNQFDSRITTRFKKDSVAENIVITLHETGHALYNLGVPKEEYGNPLGAPRELVVHESQSRLWENHVGRSPEFWRYYTDELGDISDKFNDLNPHKVFETVNSIDFDNKIRTEADELSYHLHIALRFEIGRKLINGEIGVEDLPEVWNDRMEDLLGVDVENDSEGVLQDIHWAWGNFGYFPTYSLGSVLSAQLYRKAEKEIEGLEDKISKGEFEPLLKFLRRRIHSKGQLYTTEDLIQNATGEELTADYFLDYVRSKYSELYEVDFKSDL